mmetsp:Transcript_11769/g.24695  ORF Transcript_11769/g.24695 Transcript_11769/m.24695 type:complete len:220 (+) Transcript_11769:790-1449(+)
MQGRDDLLSQRMQGSYGVICHFGIQREPLLEQPTRLSVEGDLHGQRSLPRGRHIRGDRDVLRARRMPARGGGVRGDHLRGPVHGGVVPPAGVRVRRWVGRQELQQEDHPARAGRDGAVLPGAGGAQLDLLPDRGAAGHRPAGGVGAEAGRPRALPQAPRGRLRPGGGTHHLGLLGLCRHGELQVALQLPLPLPAGESGHLLRSGVQQRGLPAGGGAVQP